MGTFSSLSLSPLEGVGLYIIDHFLSLSLFVTPFLFFWKYSEDLEQVVDFFSCLYCLDFPLHKYICYYSIVSWDGSF